MKNKWCALTVAALFATACETSSEAPEMLSEQLESLPSLAGKTDYLNSGYITPGDRIYSIGHQDGSFPDMGWHIPGEMGGIWNHPIKLMDGFSAAISLDGEQIELEKAQKFVNYPFANTHYYTLEAQDLKVRRSQFVPDQTEGMVVVFEMENNSSSTKNLLFHFRGTSDLRPTWLGERTQMVNGKDQGSFKDKQQAFLVKDQDNPWWVVFGSDRPMVERHAKQGLQQDTFQGLLTYQIDLAPQSKQQISFFVAGSYESESQSLQTFEYLKDHYRSLLAAKTSRFKAMQSHTVLETPNAALNQTFEWLKYNADAFVRHVPSQGSAIAAGYPDYPWWFGCDSEYALQGYMAIGQQEVVRNTIELLAQISEKTNGNGRIVHEVSTNGAVFNPGNINETPQFMSLLWQNYLWDGDLEFLQKHFGIAQRGMQWLLETQDSNGNLIPEGAGMMEIHGLDSEMIDVAAYTQKALSDGSKIAAVLEEKSLSERYASLASALAKTINTEFWSEEFNSYADFIGSDADALKLIEDAIVRADTLQKPWAVAELKETREYIKTHPSPIDRPFVLHHNWVVNTPMEVGVAPFENALLALDTAQKFTNPFGVFVTGIDRDATAGTEIGSFKGSKQFSYTGAVMTLPTGVQAVSEINYGRSEVALDYLLRMCRSFSYALPGSMYEVSPDYGMFTQAWNIYSFAVPVVQGFFGILPNVGQKKISISPQMPSDWDQASLKNVRMGTNSLDMKYQKNTEGLLITLVLKEDWETHLSTPRGYNLSETHKEGLTTTYKFIKE